MSNNNLRTSVNFHEEEVEIIQELTGENGPFENRSEAVRECVKQYVELRNEIEDLHNTIDRLEREKRMLIEQREEHQELVNYVEEQRSIERKRADQEERRRSANVFRRGWWWLTGEPGARED